MSKETHPPVLLWFRRGDLRLADHPAVAAAAASGQPVIPVFVREESVDALGAAPKWRLEQSLKSLAASLEAIGARLFFRSGPAQEVLEQLVADTGATQVVWTRRYDRVSREGDAAVKAALRARDVDARSFEGNLLFEPWTVATASGNPYRVFTPMWRAIRGLNVATPVAAPKQLCAPEIWPDDERLEDWALGTAMARGRDIVAGYTHPGEAAARDLLADFLQSDLERYAEARDALAEDGTSAMGDYLATGEIGVRQVWHAALAAREGGAQGAEPFLRQLGWREFAWHLMYDAPEMDRRCWRAEWEDFPWNPNPDRPEVRAWKRGQTGEPLVDAAMRQMMVTGRMHNRCRMVVASFLTKHLMADWRIGARWFEEHLTDWDAANNALGWQWVAGCGPDAAPFFRVFNPARQAERFDPKGRYRATWLAEGQSDPPEGACAYYRAAPRAWKLDPEQAPAPVIGLDDGRKRALGAYQRFRDEVKQG